MKTSTTSRAAIALSLAYALAMFHRTSFSEVSSILGHDGALSTECLAWIGSAFFWVYLGFQIPAGILVDAAGARRVSAWGSAAMAIGAGLFASASTPWMMAGARGLCAAGAVSVFLALISYCSKSFGGHSSSALGRALLIGNIGGVASGAPLEFTLDLVGWRQAWWALAAGSVIAGLATLILAPRDAPGGSIRTAARKALPAFLDSLRHADVYLAAGALAGLAGAFHAFSGFGLHQLARSLGIDGQAEGMVVSAMVGGFALGSLAWGGIGDEAKARNKAARRVPSAAFALWAWVLLAPPSNPWLLGSAMFAAGFLCACFGNVYAMLDQLSAGKAQAAIKATANCGIALGAALAQVSQGMLSGKLAALPCLVLAALGVACCWALANRCGTGQTMRGGEPSEIAVPS